MARTVLEKLERALQVVRSETTLRVIGKAMGLPWGSVK